MAKVDYLTIRQEIALWQPCIVPSRRIDLHDVDAIHSARDEKVSLFLGERAKDRRRFGLI